MKKKMKKKKQKKISLIILNWKRPQNLQMITNHLKENLPIDEVFWVNNNPDQVLEHPSDVTLINHSSDLGLWSRFTTAALAKNEHILLHDDDVLVEPEDLKTMWKRYKEDRSFVNHGVVGRMCKAKYNHDNIHGVCEILLTHCVFTNKARCLKALSKSHEFDSFFSNANPRGNGEDILLSFTGRNYSHQLDCGLPEAKDEFAIHNRVGHDKHRTDVLNWCRSQPDLFANKHPYRSDDFMVIEPCGGLGNRFRVIFSWIQAAKKLNKPLKVVWRTCSNCTDNFTDYLEVPKGLAFYEYEIGEETEEMLLVKTMRSTKTFGKHPKFDLDLSELKLLPKYDKMLKDFQSKIGKRYVAVHVRRTDRIPMMRNRNKYTAMKEYYDFIDKSGIENIFLATDCYKVQKRFEKRYGDRVFKIDELRDRGDLRQSEMSHALLDIFVAKNATAFFGTYGSSFSKTIELLRENRSCLYL